MSDVRLLSHRRGRAAVHRAAARQGSAPAPGAWRSPSLVIADERNRAELEAARAAVRVSRSCPTRRCSRPSRRRRSSWRRQDPCLITFTSGTSGEPKAVRARPALSARASACRPPLAGRAAPASWCGAPPPRAGRSRRATCSSRRGCRAPRALLHDARFDPHERLELLRARAGERAVHGADRVPRDRQARRRSRALPELRGMVAAGEALNPEVLHAWRETHGP